jgi:signal recognition particle subunit SRP54
MRKGKFDLEDLADQLAQVEKIGGLGGIMGMLPGMAKMKSQIAGANLDDRMITRQRAIILSMTPQERRTPARTIDQQRRRRIAAGSGVEPSEVSDLVKQFDGMSAMMKGMAGLGLKERVKEMQRLQGAITNPASQLARPKGDTGRRLTADERRKQKKNREKEARRRRRGPPG